MIRFYKDLFSILYNEALKGSCIYRKYAAAIVKNETVIGIGHAQTVRDTVCIVCYRMDRIQQYGEISEFFEVCPVVHAEMSAILNCNQMRDVKGSELFLLGIVSEDRSIYEKAFPCPNCYKVIQYCDIRAINVFQSDMSILRSEVLV